MGTPFNLVSRDAQRALEEFALDFAAALTQGGVEPWAKDLGLYKTSAALKTTYPIPVSAAGYKELLGDIKYRKLFERSLELKPKTWQDGVEELAHIIEAPDFIGWTSEPAAMAQAALSLPNDIIAAALAANAAHPYDGLAFFHDAHLVNVFDSAVGTFDNDFAGAGTAPSIPNLELAKERFRKIKGPNGKPLGLRLTHILAPPAQEEEWRNLLERDLIIESNGANNFGTVQNRHKGTVKLVIADEFSSDLLWYGMALNKPGMIPWIVQDEGAPEELRSDKTSDYYKRTLKIAIAYVLRGNGALGLPHCMQRWAGSP